MRRVVTLRCRDCGREYPPTKRAVCDTCFAPVDVVYDWAQVPRRTTIEARDRTFWRYFELLPIEDPRHILDLRAGFTPLVHCQKLGTQLGLRQLYVKNDAVNPTFSFKDRPGGVGVSKAVEFGDPAVGCASTGNLAAAVGAYAVKANLPCYVFAPAQLEYSKIGQILAYGARLIAVKGTYDDANRLAVLASEELGWNIVNVTSRPFYVEGSKTLAFEICEQLGWTFPDRLFIPLGSGALLCAIHRGLTQLQQTGLVPGTLPKLNGVEAEGCAPIADAFASGDEQVRPVEHPATLASSIAIGDPGDARYVLKYVRGTGGLVGAVTDEEIVEAIKLLARTEGIYTEPAGAVPIALLRRLAHERQIDPDERVVCCVTGNGLKTPELVKPEPTAILEVPPTFEALSLITR